MEGLPAEVADAMAAERYEDVASALDRMELEDPAAFETPAWPRALHMLAHIFAFRLEDARFLYKRMTEELRTGDPEVAAAWALLQRLWVKDYELLWPAVHREWSPQVQPVAHALASRLRQRMLDLVGRAYSDLSPAKLAVLLGLSEQEAVQAALDQGWEVDAPSGLVLVKQRPAPQAEAATQHQLQRLAEYVVHLET
eukprot:scaffold6.g2720.t1